MNVCIITGPSLSMRHGTGAQILRIFGDAGMEFFHLYWSTLPFGASECDRSFLLRNWEWKFPRGGRIVRSLQWRLGLHWWQGGRINARRLARLTSQKRLQADVAYVVVASEEEAGRANSLLACLRLPYIVHLMDVIHEDGLNPSRMPEHQRLFEGASSVLVLNEQLGQEARKFQAVDVRVVTFGHDVTPVTADPPAPPNELRLLMSGNLLMHQEGMKLLAQAWPRITALHPLARIVYTGPDYEAMPPELQPLVRNHGYVDKEEYEKIVRTSHLAYIAGPSILSALGRFSIPSRLSDFLMSGLPILACVAHGSAAESFVAPLVPASVRVTRSADDIVAAFDAFASSPEQWLAASHYAREFATTKLAINVVRDTIQGALSSAIAIGADL